MLQPPKHPCTDCVTGINAMGFGSIFFSCNMYYSPNHPNNYLLSVFYSIYRTISTVRNAQIILYFLRYRYLIKVINTIKYILYNKTCTKIHIAKVCLYVYIPSGRETFLFYITLHCFISQEKCIRCIRKDFCCKRWADVYL